MTGDRAHANLLKRGWSWNGETTYMRSPGRTEAGSLRLSSRHIIDENHCKIVADSTIILRTTEAKIWHQRVNAWLLSVLDGDLIWRPISTYKSFSLAASAMLGVDE